MVRVFFLAAAMFIGAMTTAAFAQDTTIVFNAGGRTVGGPSLFERTIPTRPGIARVRAFHAQTFDASVGFDICMTINNFEIPSLFVRVLVVGGSTLQARVLSRDKDVLCFPKARRATIFCDRKLSGRKCKFSWRVDQLVAE